MKKIFWFVLVALSFSVFAEGDQSYSAQRMNDRLDRMEKDLSLMQRHFYRNMDNNQTILSDQAPSIEHAKSDAKASEFEESFRGLNGKIEALEHNINLLEKKLDKVLQDIEFRFSELEGKTKKNIEQNKKEDIEPSKKEANKSKKQEIQDKKQTLGSLKLPNKGSDDIEEREAVDVKAQEEVIKQQDQYESALNSMRSAKYADAEKTFNKFISDNPKSELAGSAYFWIGEMYFGQKNYDKAAINYLKSYKNYPKAEFASESLFKLSATLAKLGKKKEACTSIAKLFKEFNNLPVAIAEKASEESSKLGCKEE